MSRADQPTGGDFSAATSVRHEPMPSCPGVPAGRGGSADGETFPPEVRELLVELHLVDASSQTTDEVAASTPSESLTLSSLVPADLPGYEALDVLGRGGMGVVYKAREIALNRLVAIKMIRAEGRIGAGELVRFMAEAEAVAAVKHPNVVEVYSCGRHAGRPYYVMEFVSGGSLARQIREAGPLAPRDAAGVVAGVARGVQAAHEAGIVHRDLKPGNVLLAVPGSRGSTLSGESRKSASGPSTSAGFIPKVSDFGLAKRLGGAEGLTQTQVVVGTPAYMAPEQARGRGKFVGPEADIYALGVILYECLTGAVPFHDDDILALLRKVTDDTPVSPRVRARGVPRDLELICLRCLAKEPRDRYATAGELADDLERFLLGRPVQARPISAVTRAYRWARRNPSPTALIAWILLVLIATPAGVVWYQGRLERLGTVAAAETEAREREQEARVAAEKLAAVRELFALQGTIRHRATVRSPGWTWANRTDLTRAAAVASGDPQALTGLRSEAMTALTAPDLRPDTPVARGMTAAVAATSPDGSVVALGEFKAWALAGFSSGRVHLVDPVTGKTVRELSFPAEGVQGADGRPVQDGARSVAFSPNGRHLFVGTRAGWVHRYDLNAPRKTPSRSWKTPATVGSLAVSNDGTAVFGVCKCEQLLRWDADGKQAAAQPVRGAVKRVVVEPQTGDLIVADGAALTRLDSRTLAPRLSIAPPGEDHVQQLAFLPGGRVLVATRDGHIEVFNPETLRRVARFAAPDLLHQVAHAAQITALAVHPSGAYLATASERGRLLKVWAVASGRPVGAVTVPGTDPVAVAWSGDGRFLVATAPGQTLRYEFASPVAEQVVGLHSDPLEAAALASDGQRVAALGEFPSPFVAGATQSLFVTHPDGRVASSVPVTCLPDTTRPGLAVHPKSGPTVVTRSGRAVWGWAPGNATVANLELTGETPRCPRYSPDGSTLWAVVDSSRVEAWDTRTWKRRGSWSNIGGELIRGLPGIDALAVGRARAVAGGADGTVQVFDERVKSVAQFPAPDDPVTAIALTPDDGTVAAGTPSGRVRVIQLAETSEPPATEAHSGEVTAVAFNHDGSLLATGGKDRSVCLWRRTADGYVKAFAVEELAAPIRSLEFARDRNRMLVLLAGERAVRLWDLDVLKKQLGEMKLSW